MLLLFIHCRVKQKRLGAEKDKRSSIAGSSDNSDAWVDISDGEIGQAPLEATAYEAQFIV